MRSVQTGQDGCFTRCWRHDHKRHSNSAVAHDTFPLPFTCSPKVRAVDCFSPAGYRICHVLVVKWIPIPHPFSFGIFAKPIDASILNAGTSSNFAPETSTETWWSSPCSSGSSFSVPTSKIKPESVIFHISSLPVSLATSSKSASYWPPAPPKRSTEASSVASPNDTCKTHSGYMLYTFTENKL